MRKQTKKELKDDALDLKALRHQEKNSISLNQYLKNRLDRLCEKEAGKVKPVTAEYIASLKKRR
jgi:hypothetical protein